MEKRAPGRPFKPGKSGNPGGRVKDCKSATEILRAKLTPEERADMLIEMAMSAKDERVKLQARLAIWDRTDGKVKDQLEVSGGISPEQQALLDALRMTPHERRQALEAEPKSDAPDEG